MLNLLCSVLSWPKVQVWGELQLVNAVSAPGLPSAAPPDQAETQTLQMVLLGAPVCLLHLLCLRLVSQQTCGCCTDCLKACLLSEVQKQATLQLA